MTVLQPRDRKLLELLSKYGILSTTQIKELCFKGIAHTTVMRRLRKLEEMGMISRRRGLDNAMSAWCLTKFGASKIDAEFPFQYRNQNAITHEVTLSQVRMALEHVGIGNDWTSEMEMRRRWQWQRGMRRDDNRVIPDGLFLVERAGQLEAIAVELELHAKGHVRYKKLFEDYRFKHEIKWIWYIVASESIGKTILSQWNSVLKINGSPKLIVSLLHEVLEAPINARVFLENGKSSLQKFFELEKRSSKLGNVEGAAAAHEVSKATENSVENKNEEAA